MLVGWDMFTDGAFALFLSYRFKSLLCSTGGLRAGFAWSLCSDRNNVLSFVACL